MRKRTVTLCQTLAVLLGGVGESFALPECDGSPIEFTSLADFAEWDNCEGTYTYANGGKYVGEWKNDRTHGQGTYTFFNEDKYVSE